MAQESGSAAGLCASDETVLFNCPVSKKKLLSICASKNYGPDTGYMQYRYGPQGKPELVLPAKKTAPARSAKSGTWMFSGGGGAYVRFDNGKTSYYVYTAIGKWGENGAPLSKAGVAVLKNGVQKANILCKAPETSELGPVLFDQMGLPADEEMLELPE